MGFIEPISSFLKAIIFGYDQLIGSVFLANAALQVDDGSVVINNRLVLGADIIPVLEDAA